MSTKIPNVTTLGIDLGTTMSCMAGMVHGELQIIDNSDGERITPSIVCFPKDSKTGKVSVGSNAILAAQTNPDNYVYEAKRMFGKGYWNSDIQKSMKYWPFKIREIKGGKSEADKTKVEDNIGIVVNIDGKEQIYEPIQISASVLNYMAESARTRLNAFPTFIVITVPAYFHDGAKQRTLGASQIAFGRKKDENGNSLEVKTVLLAEPTAAAMAYGSMMIKNKQVKPNQDERILVFDLGGGTYDVSILEFCYDESNPVGEVKATDGDNYLGGGDFDNIIVKMAKEEFVRKFGQETVDNCDPTEAKKNEIRLRQEAIKVKTQLSSNTTVTFNLPCYRGERGINFELSRSRFERASKQLFDRLEEKVKGVLLSYGRINSVYTDNGVLDASATIRANPGCNTNLDSVIQNSKKEIDRVIMVGGSSRIPKVSQTLMRMFGETETTPTAQKKVVAVMNPDESIAYGAGYYANACCPAEGDQGGHILLIDKVPLHLCIETLGGQATPLIHARTPIPAKQTQVFSTAADNQTAVTIRITQGNRAKSCDNYNVGEFNLDGIAPARKGEPKIEVSVEVDENNLLKVTARDLNTKNEQMFVQNLSKNLSDDDIERMKKVAEEHEEGDRVFRQRTDAKNTHEAWLYMMEDACEKSTAPADVVSGIKADIDQEIKWLNSEEFMGLTVEEINSHIQEQKDAISKKLATQGAGDAQQPQGNPDVTPM
ncbi:HSP7B [Enterospora canceri]|uniref:HSP7B n=1 Tax=Enterospora canceri TaxID=1081671 RepID=A0A1Y1S7I9_9MICR|nr:HSP7B [Enterospora canceri]